MQIVSNHVLSYYYQVRSNWPRINLELFRYQWTVLCHEDLASNTNSVVKVSPHLQMWMFHRTNLATHLQSNVERYDKIYVKKSEKLLVRRKNIQSIFTSCALKSVSCNHTGLVYESLPRRRLPFTTYIPWATKGYIVQTISINNEVPP